MSPLARSLTRCQEELQRAEGVARAAREAEMGAIAGCDRWEREEEMGWEGEGWDGAGWNGPLLTSTHDHSDTRDQVRRLLPDRS